MLSIPQEIQHQKYKPLLEISFGPRNGVGLLMGKVERKDMVGLYKYYKEN